MMMMQEKTSSISVMNEGIIVLGFVAMFAFGYCGESGFLSAVQQFSA